eukprot:3055278-Pleurochrysis_carterae.AAC.1
MSSVFANPAQRELRIGERNLRVLERKLLGALQEGDPEHEIELPTSLVALGLRVRRPTATHVNQRIKIGSEPPRRAAERLSRLRRARRARQGLLAHVRRRRVQLECGREGRACSGHLAREPLLLEPQAGGNHLCESPLLPSPPPQTPVRRSAQLLGQCARARALSIVHQSGRATRFLATRDMLISTTSTAASTTRESGANPIILIETVVVAKALRCEFVAITR